MSFKKINFLIFFLLFSFARCSTNNAPYGLEFLEGDWERINSTDARSDSMQLRVAGDSAYLLFVPPGSDFSLNQKKWFSITTNNENSIHFTLKDISADQSYATAQITITSDTSLTLENIDFPLAPGALQYWKKNP